MYNLFNIFCVLLLLHAALASHKSSFRSPEEICVYNYINNAEMSTGFVIEYILYIWDLEGSMNIIKANFKRLKLKLY